MGIHESTSLLNWSYFLALESDIEKLSRYVEFTNGNFGAYSIEVAHILLAASSEVDVVAKQLCKVLNPESTVSNINNYKDTLKEQLPELETSIVTLPRYGLELVPWSNWQHNKNPNWWHSHTKVKHERDQYFSEANIENVLNSMAGLLLLVLHYYRNTIDGRRMEPPPSIFTPHADLASVCPSIGGRMALFFNVQE